MKRRASSAQDVCAAKRRLRQAQFELAQDEARLRQLDNNVPTGWSVKHRESHEYSGQYDGIITVTLMENVHQQHNGVESMHTLVVHLQNDGDDLNEIQVGTTGNGIEITTQGNVEAGTVFGALSKFFKNVQVPV